VVGGGCQPANQQCGPQQTKIYIVKRCPLTKFKGGMQPLHDVKDDMLNRPEATVLVNESNKAGDEIGKSRWY